MKQSIFQAFKKLLYFHRQDGQAGQARFPWNVIPWPETGRFAQGILRNRRNGSSISRARSPFEEVDNELNEEKKENDREKEKGRKRERERELRNFSHL